MTLDKWLQDFVLGLTPEIVANLILYILLTSILVFLEYRETARNKLKICAGFWALLFFCSMFVSVFPQTVTLFWGATGATFIFTFILQRLKSEELEAKEEDLNKVESAFQKQGQVVLTGIMDALTTAQVQQVTPKMILEAIANVANTNANTNPNQREEYERIELLFKSLAGVA